MRFAGGWAGATAAKAQRAAAQIFEQLMAIEFTANPVGPASAGPPATIIFIGPMNFSAVSCAVTSLTSEFPRKN